MKYLLVLLFLFSIFSCRTSKIDFQRTITSDNIDSILPLSKTGGYVVKDSLHLKFEKHN